MLRILLLFLFTFSGLQAFVVNNPAASGLVDCGAFFDNCHRFSLRVGYDADFVFDGKMKKKDSDQRVDSFEQKNFLGFVTLNFCDRFDLFGKAGQSNIDTDYRIFLEDGDAYNVDCKSHFDLSWAVGTSMILLDYQCLQVGVGVSYFQTEPSLTSLKLNGEELPIDDSKIKFKSIDAFFGLSFQTGILIPYICFHYRKADATISAIEGPIADNGKASVDLKERCPYGLALGVSITNKRQFALTIESRVISEEALTVTGTFRF